MAISFKAADLIATTSRTGSYQCPVGTQSVVFAGTIANIDNSLGQEHWATLEIQKVDTSYVVLMNKIPIPYANSLNVPKITLLPGERLFVSADAAASVQVRLSIIEKV